MMILNKPKILFLIFAVMVLLFQPMKSGFAPGHHGWVTAHTLAEISNATPENHFLGFTQKSMVDGKVDYFYFDRYPFIFAGTMNRFLSIFWDKLDISIHVARELMNLIFILSAFLIWKICRLILKDDEKATTVTSFVISASLLVKYKDMVHFDQPALLGCLWALYGILDFETNRNRKNLVLSSLLGPLLGRGYAVIFILAGWLLVKFIKELRFTKNVFVSVRHLPLIYLLISVPLPVLMLGSNILGEARIRNVDWRETSIVQSATHRLGFQNYKTSDSKEKKFSWASYISNQIQRTFDYVTPYVVYGIHVKDYKRKVLHYTTIVPKALFQLLLLFIFFKFFRSWWQKLEEWRRDAFLYLISGGLLWMIVMRNLAHYHEYVTLYLIGFVILSWCFLVDLISSRWVHVQRASLICAVLSLGLHSAIGWKEASEIGWQSREFQKIRHELQAQGVERVYLTPDFESFFLEGVKWGDSFFLSGFIITHRLQDSQKQVVRIETPSGAALELREPTL